VRIGSHAALGLTGHLHLPELRAEIAFRSHSANGKTNGNGSGHVEEHWATATIIPHHFTMSIPFQYLAPPAREECDVWALTPAADHDPPWIEHYAGTLQGEPLTFDQHIPVDAILDVTFTPRGGQAGREVIVDVAGNLRFERSIPMRLLFRDPERSMAPTSESDRDEAVLIVAGTRIAIPRQTVSSLAGRNSWMTVRVMDAERRIVCVEQPLGGPVRSAA